MLKAKTIQQSIYYTLRRHVEYRRSTYMNWLLTLSDEDSDRILTIDPNTDPKEWIRGVSKKDPAFMARLINAIEYPSLYA